MEAFCRHFISGASPQVILDECFQAELPRIHEHGPEWASSKLPYLFKTWCGRGLAKGTCDDYFKVLGETLRFFPDDHSIPSSESFLVDPFNRKGVIKARCRLEGAVSGVSWEEQFIFLFSEFNSENKIGLLEIWSDTLSAWKAVTTKSATDST